MMVWVSIPVGIPSIIIKEPLQNNTPKGTQNPKPNPLDPLGKPSTLSPKPYKLFRPSTLNPKPLNPISPKPSKPKPQTLNPKPLNP